MGESRTHVGSVERVEGKGVAILVRHKGQCEFN